MEKVEKSSKKLGKIDKVRKSQEKLKKFEKVEKVRKSREKLKKFGKLEKDRKSSKKSRKVEKARISREGLENPRKVDKVRKSREKLKIFKKAEKYRGENWQHLPYFPPGRDSSPVGVCGHQRPIQSIEVERELRSLLRDPNRPERGRPGSSRDGGKISSVHRPIGESVDSGVRGARGPVRWRGVKRGEMCEKF